LDPFRIGIVLGDKKFFIRSISDWKETKISDSYIKPIVSKFSYLDGLRLKNDDIKSWRKDDLECFFLNTRGKRLGSCVSSYLLKKEENGSEKIALLSVGAYGINLTMAKFVMRL
jgi:hypothetical protein